MFYIPMPLCSTYSPLCSTSLCLCVLLAQSFPAVYDGLSTTNGVVDMQVTSKVTWATFSERFDSIATFYWNGFFTRIDDEGLVFDYALDDHVPCDTVFETLPSFKYIVVVYKSFNVNVSGMTLAEVNEINLK